MVNRDDVSRSVSKHHSDYKCKGFYTWDHLVSMLFCTLSGCTSLREVAAGFLGLKGKTGHLALGKLPRRSTLSDANHKRPAAVFEAIYKRLLTRYLPLIPDSRMRHQFGHRVFLIDSTTISLFHALLKGAGRIPASGRQKGGIKVHTLLNPDEQVPRLVWISEAATNDITFLDQLDFEPDAIYVFDKGYVDYKRYEQLTAQGVFFVTRLKENAAFNTVAERALDEETDAAVLKDEDIELPIRRNGKVVRWVPLRRVAYWEERGERTFEFLTNLPHIDAAQIALLYKERWQIELLFKQLKQNFPLKYFLGDNSNAMEIQIWCTLITNLLLTIVKSKVRRNWAFSNIVTFSRIHLFNHIHLLRFLENPDKDWQEPEDSLQLLLFSG